MKRPGIFGTIGLVGSLIFAIPVTIVGVETFLRGEVLIGSVFLGLAVLMVGLQEYLTNPARYRPEWTKRPTEKVRRFVGRGRTGGASTENEE